MQRPKFKVLDKTKALYVRLPPKVHSALKSEAAKSLSSLEDLVLTELQKAYPGAFKNA